MLLVRAVSSSCRNKLELIGGEEGEGVNGHQTSLERQRKHPELDIQESILDKLPLELRRKTVIIELKPFNNERLLCRV